MNVNYLSASALQSSYPTVIVKWYAYSGQINVMGNISVSYSEPVILNANVQLMDKQKLRFIDGYNDSKIYMSFWVSKSEITGLNRNISTGGDYLLYSNLVFKVIELEDNFNTGWVKINCVESDVE